MTTIERLKQLAITAALYNDEKTHNMLMDAASEIEALQKDNLELKGKNLAWALGIEQSNTDIVDMHRDEFRRIIALTDDSEIKSICERAIACIEQTVPVVVQRDSLRARVSELEKEVERWKQSCQSEAKRDGKWLDEWGACRVCGGEIPHGHTKTCDLHKEQMENRTLHSTVAELQKDKHRLLRTFQHTHKNNGQDDSCDFCGLDLRDEIHIRSAAMSEKK